jgi:hypothetical protein
MHVYVYAYIQKNISYALEKMVIDVLVRTYTVRKRTPVAPLYFDEVIF